MPVNSFFDYCRIIALMYLCDVNEAFVRGDKNDIFDKLSDIGDIYLPGNEWGK
jgi:hypothetical protein